MRSKTGKIITASLASLFALIAIVSGTLAWRDYSQHKTNEGEGGEDTLYSVVLIDYYDKPDNWTPEDDPVDKKVRVRNDGAEDFGAMYVRLQLKDYMDISKREMKFTKERYMINDNGAFVYFPTEEAALKAYPKNKTQKLTDAVHNVSGWFIQTKSDDPNGEYGKFLCTAISEGTPKSLLEGYVRAQKDADVNHQIVPNGECAYHVKLWDGKTTAIDEYINVTLGKDVTTLKDWNKNPGALWVLGSNGWIYWAQALERGQTTSNLVESLKLLKETDGAFYYALHVDMEATSYDELRSRWTDADKEILDAYDKEKGNKETSTMTGSSSVTSTTAKPTESLPPATSSSAPSSNSPTSDPSQEGPSLILDYTPTIPGLPNAKKADTPVANQLIGEQKWAEDMDAFLYFETTDKVENYTVALPNAIVKPAGTTVKWSTNNPYKIKFNGDGSFTIVGGNNLVTGTTITCTASNGLSKTFGINNTNS